MLKHRASVPSKSFAGAPPHQDRGGKRSDLSDGVHIWQLSRWLYTVAGLQFNTLEYDVRSQAQASIAIFPFVELQKWDEQCVVPTREHDTYFAPVTGLEIIVLSINPPRQTSNAYHASDVHVP